MSAIDRRLRSAAPPLRLAWKRPPLYPKQRLAMFDAPDHTGAPARISLIEASTKAGKTHSAICWLAERAFLDGKPGRNFWWVAPVNAQAKIAYRRLKLALPPWTHEVNASELFIRLINGATIWFKNAEKPDNLYGDDVYACVIDEASRVREAAWHAVRSTLTATRGPLRCIGNVKGRKNWFFRLARQAEAGADGLHFSKLTAWDAVEGGVLDREEIEDARRLLPEAVFRELYLAEASDDEGNPFGFAHIAACLGPLSPHPPVAVGVDLARSQDWTVVVGLDRHGAVCGIERWQGVPWGETTARLADLIGARPALVDSTGVGDPIVEALQRRCPQVRGFTFTAASKQRLMEGLALSIQSRALTIPDGPIRLELEAFEYVYTRTGIRYAAPEGAHDDCVMALALANALWRGSEGHAVAEPVGIPRLSPWLDAAPAAPGGDYAYLEGLAP